MLDFAAEVDKAFPMVQRVRNEVFPHINADYVKLVHDQTDPHDQGAHYIEFGCYILTPIEGRRPSLKGDIPCLKWNLMMIVSHPGRFNPFDGGDPPYDDEIDKGEFDNVGLCLAEIGRDEVCAKIDGVAEAMMHEQMAKEEAEYEKYMAENPPEPELCPHGKQVHECNACLEHGDRMYDAMRERRFWGRR